MTTELKNVLSRLEGVRSVEGGHEARCPAHEDGVPSLSVSLGDDGRVLLKCHAGCSTQAVVAAAGLALTDLFPPRTQYVYRDEAGKSLFRVVRGPVVDGEKTFWQNPSDGNGGWRTGKGCMQGVRLVPFQLPQLLAADLSRPCYIVEGEKDVLSLAAIGAVATTNPGGAGKWRPEFNEFLRGRLCVLLPDNDKPGLDHMRTVARHLQDVAEEARILTLPGLPPKGDVSDYLANGGTRETLDELAAAAPVLSETADLSDDAPASTDTPPAGAALVSLTAEEMLAIRRPPREFILEPILRTKDLAMLVAKRGVGKTWISVGMASATAAGGEFLVWRAPKPRSVLYVDGELPFETVQERLELTRTMHGHDWGGRLRILAADYQERSIPSLNLPEGQRLVEEHLGEAEILFLDNLSALCTGGVENEAESWQPMQDWLLSLRRRGIAVLFDHHAGTSGNQRGTSKREDVLDLSIKLEHPADYDSRDGARFVVTYTKARGIHGKAAEAFEARLGTGDLSSSRWITKTCSAATKERVLNLHENGLTQAEIGKELGKDKSTVSRIIKQARESGEIQ
jgi:putative DNA primase/helicase